MRRTKSSGARQSQGNVRLVTATPATPPDPEVVERPVRRVFTAEYRQRILREADQCGSGEIGALLRREGLYRSHLSKWRQQRDRAERTVLATKKPGRKPQPANPLKDRVVELEREVVRLQSRLKQAETIIDVQKKISEILSIPLNQPDKDGNG